MTTFFISTLVFLAAYLVNMFYITVFYHRGLTHGAVLLNPRTRKWVINTGSWVTGIDPKAWACMHRMHHQFSDTEHDPHSPWHKGFFGLAIAQLVNYEKILVGLEKNKPHYLEQVRDLDFPISWVHRKRLWLLPYFLHGLIGIALAWLTRGFISASWMVGVAYLAGMISHPIQGWMVNSFAHRFGYQNHQNGDESRNNTVIAWLTLGEGYQNNHHHNPASPKFSERWFEMDLGYVFCVFAERMQWLQLNRKRAQ